MQRHLPWVAAFLLLGAAAVNAQLRLVDRREQPISGPILALAWVDETRLLVLGSRQVSLAAWRAGALLRLDALDLPPASARARVEAGLLALDEDGATVWLTTNRINHSLLVAVEGERLTLRSEALAVPWPGSPSGLRFQEGTNVLTGLPPSWEGTPLLAVAPDRADLGVGTSGELLGLAADGPRPVAAVRVGPTLAPLATGLLAASSARPPGGSDDVTILRRTDDAWKPVATLPIEGAVRAIASHALEHGYRLACAVESGGRLPWRLILVDLAADTP